MEWRSGDHSPPLHSQPHNVYWKSRILVCFWAPQADFSPLRGALHVFSLFKYVFTRKNPVKLDWPITPVNLLFFFKYPVNLARLPPYPNQRGSSHLKFLKGGPFTSGMRRPKFSRLRRRIFYTSSHRLSESVKGHVVFFDPMSHFWGPRKLD